MRGHRAGSIKMPHRAASPAASENEFDITSALLQDGADDDLFGGSTSKDLDSFGAGGILDLGLESDDDDEAFIAAQQAASNRKASNLKGRSVKKGGGFQAMGLSPLSICFYYHANLHRLECTSAQGHHTKRIFSPYPYSAQDYTSCPRRSRCGGNGKNRLGQDRCFRHSHD